LTAIVRIFLAGAGGAIGRRLTPLLISAGHAVTGTTRSAEKADDLKAAGIEPVVVDVFDQDALRDAVVRARPDVVIHQLTDLPQVIDPAQLAGWLARNARLRIEGTANLIAAALAAGARRLIAQSIAFSYADGPEPHGESDPLVSAKGDGPGAISARGVRPGRGRAQHTRHRRHRAALRASVRPRHLEYPQRAGATARRCRRARRAACHHPRILWYLQYR
jgi:hypothetical protein